MDRAPAPNPPHPSTPNGTRAERLRVWINRWPAANETVLLSLLAVAMGIAASAGVWLFKALIELFHNLIFEHLGTALQPLGGWTVALLPVLGGLLVGLIAYYLVGEERHHGVAGIMEAVALAGGRLRYKRLPAKTVAAALSIGSGASVGPEDPSVQIGANIASLLGQHLHLSDERMRSLVAGGAAAGVAAAFNAPIAGVFFALEIILGEIGGSALSVVVVAAVASAAFTQAVSGAQPAFRVPPYAFQSAAELPLYLGLGLLAGPLAAGYVRLLYRLQDLFRAWPAPRWLKPAAAGLLVGVTGIFLPQVFGVGYETIEAVLLSQSLVAAGGWLAQALPLALLLLVLMLAKLILTPVSIGGGFMGGVFAPSLYLGAMLGGAYALLLDRLLPGGAIAPPAFAMVGMAAVLAGAVHAPLTAILLLFEMTNDYRIILPLMFAVTVSLLVSQRIQRDSVYTLGLARKGIRLDRGRDVEVLQAIRVSEVMQPVTATLRESDSLLFASQELLRARRHGMPVLNASGELAGIITLSDLDRVQSSDPDRGLNGLTVGQVCTRSLLLTQPDESIGAALRRMSQRDIGRMPVVDPEQPRRLVGVLRRSDVIRAYDVALTRRATFRHQAQQARLGALSPEGVNISEVTISAGAECAGQCMKDIAWPEDVIIASVRRGREVIVPRGDTRLQAGDVLVAVAGDKGRQQVQEICTRSKEA